MLPVLALLPAGPDWAYELKWDGIRALVTIHAGTVRVTSRNERDITAAWPELGTLADLAEDALLDGEIVALEHGRPSFERLQQRMHLRDPVRVERQQAANPVSVVVFDLLRLGDRSLLDEPYRRRREQLERLSLPRPAVLSPRFSDGPATLQAARDQGLEGVVAKRLSSTYRPGTRTTAWVKTKIIKSLDVVVCGYTAGGGRRAGRIGSLLLGVYDTDLVLRYAGHVGTGFTDTMLAELARRLAPLRRPTAPFEPGEVPREYVRLAIWCEPELVVEVAYASWTSDGRLRHPSFRGLRPDKDPGEATR
jgi:bifunctional non-homologous end joining protein LigD